VATRLYFHSTTNGTPGLPTAEQSAALTSVQNLEGSQTTNRLMNTTIGTSQQVISAEGNQDNPATVYVSRWVSPPIYQSSIAANTWTYSFAAKEVVSQQNFPVSATDKAVPVNCYVWRPGGTKVGTILDGNTAATVDEGAANVERGSTTTFTGASVASVQNGDVIVFEAWFSCTLITGAGAVMSYYYDGNTVTTTDGTVSSHASFIETPENLNFTPVPVDMTITASKTYSNKFITKV
jgi:hypothetical protein